MNDKKLYIIFTTGNIHHIGGMQMYISGITDFLSKKGFEVIVFSPSEFWGKCEIMNLEKYILGGNELLWFPPAVFTNDEIDKIFHHSMKIYGIIPSDYSTVYVESHSDVDALWAELFAKKLHGKHIALLLNEKYDGKDNKYKEYLDFFWQMHTEGRLEGRLLEPLFKEKGLEVKKIYDGWAKERNPFGDILNEKVELLDRKTWNIAYIGRGNKEYVPTIVNEIAFFASKHKEKDIQFVFVGDSLCQEELIKTKIGSQNNLCFTPLGNLIPIPKSFFSKVDVIIANSQTAHFCALEGVPVVTVSTKDFYSSGVLGYDCHVNEDPNFREEKCERISCVLEDIFVKKEYSKKTFEIPSLKDVSEVYEKSIKSFDNLNIHKYYDVVNHICNNTINNIKKYIDNLRLLKKWKFDINKLKRGRIVVFGAGFEGRRCIKWLLFNNLVDLIVIDNDPQKWGEELDGYIINSPNILNSQEIEGCIICSVNFSEDIYEQIYKEYNIEKEKCTTFQYIRMIWFVDDDKTLFY